MEMGTALVKKLNDGPVTQEDIDEEFEYDRAAEDEADLIILKARQMTKDQEDFSRAMERTHQAIGWVQANTLMARHTTLAALVELKKLKESGEYKKAGKTWAQCCEESGWARRTIDRLILDLRPLAEEFLVRLAEKRFTVIEAKRLAMLGTSVKLVDASKASQIGHVANSEAAIIIDEKEVPFDETHRNEILAIVDEALSKREKDTKKIQKELTEANKEHSTEKKSLLKEIERLKPFDPEDKALDANLKQVLSLEKMVGEVENALRRFSFDKRLNINEHPEIVARIHGAIVRTITRWRELEKDFEHYLNEDEE
jgi:hypothetical protein